MAACTELSFQEVKESDPFFSQTRVRAGVAVAPIRTPTPTQNRNVENYKRITFIFVRQVPGTSSGGELVDIRDKKVIRSIRESVQAAAQEWDLKVLEEIDLILRNIKAALGGHLPIEDQVQIRAILKEQREPQKKDECVVM